MLELNICGNRVLEPGEDCDGQPGCGAAGTPTACRYTCNLDEGVACPDGFGCGLDDICRRPTGSFEAEIASGTITTRDLLVGDVNGDHCAEIVRTTLRGEVVVTALPSQVSDDCPASEQTLRTNRPGMNLQSYPAPLLVDLTGNGRLDLVAAGNGLLDSAGLLVYAADTAPVFTPVLYPNLRQMENGVRTLRVHRQMFNPDHDQLLLLLGEPDGTDGEVALIEDPHNKPMPLGAFPGGFAGLVGLGAAELDAGDAMAGDPCDEVVMARAGAQSLQIYSLCGPGETPELASIFTLPIGVAVRETNPTLDLLDVDFDGHIDLLVTGTDDKMHVAYGLGDGRFHSMPFGSMPPATPDNKMGILPYLGPMNIEPDSLLVVGQFDDMNPGLEVQQVLCPPSGAFSSPVCGEIDGPCEAVVTDIDADGRDDILSSGGQEPDIAVLRGKGNGTFHVTFLETQCPPHRLTPGDIDGDGIPDLAFYDQRTLADEPVTTIAVTYGQAFASPSAPEALGRFEEAIDLTAGRFLPNSIGSQLFAARGQLIPQQDGEPVPSGVALALVEGQEERVLLAPFYFPSPMNDMNSITQVQMDAIAAGRFAQTPGGAPRAGLAALTDKGLWHVRGEEDAGSLDAIQTQGAPIGCATCVLAALPRSDNEEDTLLLLAGDKIVAYEVTPAGFAETDSFPTAYTFDSIDASSNPPKYTPRPLVADLDGDGLTDLIARESGGALVALWGRSDGGFDEAILAPAPACSPACPGLSVATLNADADPAKELAIIGPGQLDLYDDLVTGARTLVPLAAEALSVTPDIGTDFTAIGAADFDGNGVDDLIVMPSSTFYTIFLGTAERE